LGARRAVSAAAADGDVSAAVKLLQRDRETATSDQDLAVLETRVSSNLLEVELRGGLLPLLARDEFGAPIGRPSSASAAKAAATRPRPRLWPFVQLSSPRR